MFYKLIGLKVKTLKFDISSQKINNKNEFVGSN